MKLIFLGIIISLQSLSGQKFVEGIPYSLEKKIPLRSESVMLPYVNHDDLLAEDEYAEPGTPFRYGYIHEENINSSSHGNWEETVEGGLLWQITIESEGAYAIGLEYENFHIPQGGELFVFSPDYSTIYGAYTSANNIPERRFSSPLLPGDVAVIEYFQPAEVTGEFSLIITEIIHDYRDIMKFTEETRNRDCGTNVVCSEADAYEDPINSAAWLDMGGYICSGAMVNNVRQDLTPYFLTAWHCVDGDWPGSFRFYFNYQTSSCSGSWGSNGPYAYSSDLLADSDGMDSDWALLLITDDIEELWEVFYAGWDATGDYPQITCGVHHPGGDPKKINFDNDQAWGDYWDSPVGPTTHWKVNWDSGGTEGGSSGSPLFDDRFRIVGQLSGGPAGACGTSYDLYGKFSRAWSWEEPTNRRVLDYLDPDYTGTLEIDGTYVEVTGIAGDLNGDDVVNILDIIALANLIFEGNPSSEDLAMADMNGDGTLNILDIITIVNIILEV